MSKQIDFLKNEIKKTGYPLEIEISSLLDKEWQTVINTDSYYDRDEQKLRDIDICAFDDFEAPKNLPITAQARLVVECKKSEDFAWIFFTRPFRFDLVEVAGQYVDEVQIKTKNTENYQVMNMVLGKTGLHYRDLRRHAVAYDEFNLKGKKESFEQKKKEIFEAQNQLKKYVGCYIEQTIESSPTSDLYTIFMSFPCIVFDGSMYEAIVHNGNLRLRESKHLALFTLYRCPYSIFEKCILIDIVNKDYFTEYLKVIRKDVTSLRKQINRDSVKIVEKIDEVRELQSAGAKTDLPRRT